MLAFPNLWARRFPGTKNSPDTCTRASGVPSSSIPRPEITAPRGSAIVALSNTCPSTIAIGRPGSNGPGPFGRAAPYPIDKYCGTYGPADATSR
ncbi:MAG: hypothetical protein DMF85_01720 [Acidobacteria bacterium]|nr:MAG: hypothetical protein DMF85_01720 [Acidobacteriota bacterium]